MDFLCTRARHSSKYVESVNLNRIVVDRLSLCMNDLSVLTSVQAHTSQGTTYLHTCTFIVSCFIFDINVIAYNN